jgi:regulator of protease activity HflC (stomatin/prohibitin superfamily)
MDTVLSYFAYGLIGFAVFIILGSFFTVRTAELAIITRFGQFLRIANPGLGWKIPFIDSLEDYADDGNQDQGQCLCDDPHLGADAGAAGEGV